MPEDFTHNIHYSEISKISTETFEPGDLVNILFDSNDLNSVMARLTVLENGRFLRTEYYQSLKEFSTVSMKELLTLYAKREIIKTDMSYYSEDDPKLHAFLSKLSYSGIETICKHIPEFAAPFKEGKITLQLPKLNKSNRSIK